MKEILYLHTSREGYAVSQIHRTMTVGDLISFLEGFDEDTPVYLCNDNGYTYGPIREDRFASDEIEDGEDEEE